MGEEDEGGEEEGEPAFEVRQTEMVWGGQGLGTGESPEKHLATSDVHGAIITPRTLPPLAYLSLSLPVFLSQIGRAHV